MFFAPIPSGRNDRFYNFMQNILGWSLKPNAEMLLLFKLWIDENKPDKKQVDSKRYQRMLLNLAPCSFHFFTPVYVIKNK